MLKDYLKYWKLLLVFVVLYPFFTLIKVCPVSKDLSHVDVNSLQPVTYYVCVAGNKVLHPVVANHIIPNYDHYVKHKIIKIDDTLRYTKTINKIKSGYITFQKTLRIHRTVNYLGQKVSVLISKLNYNYFVYIHPTISKVWNLLKLKSQYYTRLGLIKVKYSFKITIDKIRIVIKRFWNYLGYKFWQSVDNIQSIYNTFVNYLSLKLAQWFDKVKTIEFIANIIYWWDQMVDKLVFKAQDYELYEKKEFLKAEFKNLSRFNQFYKFNSSINLVELVNNLLHDAQQKVVSVGEKFKGEKSAFEQEVEREKELEHEEEIEEESENVFFDDVIEDLDKNADELLEPIEGDFTQIIEGEFLEVIDEETSFDIPETVNIPGEIPPVYITSDTNATEFFDSDESEDEGPLTIKLTSTVTVTQEAETTDGISVDNVSDGIKQINQELIDWETKVNNTIKLATNNLEFEMQPKISEIIEVIKPTISEKLTQVQIENYQNYQNLNKKILEINRDYEKIYSSNDSTIETVSRQEIRDDISSAYKLDEDVVEEVQLLLIVNHESILKDYFTILQDTIDILESFSETAVNEYSKRFTKTLEDVAVDDETLWNSWKQFYKIKDGIFEFRNHIFDVANEYKTRELKSTYTDIIGLGAWNEYINNINFHIKFITKDNDEYMKLIRAQANIAFQSREGLVMDIERREKEQQEQVEVKRIEQEKLAELKKQILIEELKQQVKSELAQEKQNKNEGVSLTEGINVTSSKVEGVSHTVEPISDENIKTGDGDIDNASEVEDASDIDIETEIVEIEIDEEIDDEIEVDDFDASSTSAISTIISTTTSVSTSTSISTSISTVHESIEQTDEDYEDHLSDDEKTDDEN